MIEVQLLAKKGQDDPTTDVQIQYLDCPEGCDVDTLAQTLVKVIRDTIDNAEVGNGGEEEK